MVDARDAVGEAFETEADLCAANIAALEGEIWVAGENIQDPVEVANLQAQLAALKAELKPIKEDATKA